MLAKFLNRKTITCPRCVAEIKANKDTKACPVCGFSIPNIYIEDYEDAKPLYIQVFGWTRVGKSMFFDVLRLHLYDMGLLWKKYGFFPVTELDFIHQEILRDQRLAGELPDSTKVKDRDENNEVYVMKLSHMDRWGTRHLIMMDHAGERFEHFDDFPMKEVPYLLKNPVTLMLISLSDMKGGKQMDQMLQVYVKALRAAGVKFERERRKLIVIFTKADNIVGLPENLANYISYDEFWDQISDTRSSEIKPIDMPEYLERMKNVSAEIRDWLVRDRSIARGGANFVRLAENQYNLETHYTMMSATGRDISADDSGKIVISPRRVLDPFFWALEMGSEVMKR